MSHWLSQSDVSEYSSVRGPTLRSGHTRRVWPLRDVGPLTDEYSLTSDWDNQWLTGGLEAEVIAEAHLDPKSIFNGIQRFASEREKRISQQKNLLTD